ncbi:uncharacterized protein DEA37_0003226 [Paragonimus westermani]|uniref:Reverse transcriptase domain-containing protein n=1 Tax=Paragonimus westermani TaxID=34504 RepID=A0A5J4NRH2_9TREM|nr:uncharacterized protein DEA37_0003226 [Paragonimus westermani]
MTPVCKRIPGSPHSQPSRARGVNPRTFTSRLLPADFDESDEAATPQTVQTTSIDENHNVNENDVHGAMTPVCKRIPGSPHSQPSRARGVNPRTFTSRLLPADFDESDEAATPQTVQTTSIDENHNVNEEHRRTFEQPQTQPDGVSVDISSSLSEEAHRVLSDLDNRDEAPNHLAIVDDQLHQPINLESFQSTLEEFCRKWYPHRRGSSHGMDKLKPAQSQKRNVDSIAAFLNVLLAAKKLPDHLNVAGITLVPKSSSSSQPSDFRPIYVTSVFIRLLHKTIFNRWI